MEALSLSFSLRDEEGWLEVALLSSVVAACKARGSMYNRVMEGVEGGRGKLVIMCGHCRNLYLPCEVKGNLAVD